MQKIKLSNEQLSNVISLRKAGGKWLAIEKEIGISRHIAKREYEDWERLQALGELKEARKDVAAEAFREHVNYLVQVAETLTDRLRVPTVKDRGFNTDQFLDGIWKTDIISKTVSSGSSNTKKKNDPMRNLRENRMLFQSLVTHTRDKVQWKDLDEWKEGWNVCISRISSLRQAALKMINDSLAREEHDYPSLTKHITEHAQHQRPLEQMAGAIILELLRRLENDKLDPEQPVTKCYSREGFENVTQLTFSYSYTPILKFTDSLSAKAANRVCNSVAKELFKNRDKDSIESLKNSISMIRKVRGRFKEALDPLVLRPMILRTRCDLCPA